MSRLLPSYVNEAAATRDKLCKPLPCCSTSTREASAPRYLKTEENGINVYLTNEILCFYSDILAFVEQI